MAGRPKYTILDQEQFNFGNLEAITSETGRVYRTPDGQLYPSVTTVLGSVKNEGLKKWRERVGEEEANRVMRHAAARGTALHEAVEKYCLNVDEYFAQDEMPHVKSMFKAIEPVLHRIGVIAALEAPLYSHKYKLAGRVDIVADFDGKPSIIDIKSSSRKKRASDISNYFMQATAYALMFEERTAIPIDQVVIIMAVENEPDPIVFIERRHNWEPPLLEVINQYRKTLEV